MAALRPIADIHGAIFSGVSSAIGVSAGNTHFSGIKVATLSD